MANVFLTVLGTRFYSECDYFYGNQTIRAKYIQEALIKILGQDWKQENGDKVVVLLTEDARKKNYITVDENDIKLDRFLKECGLNIEEVTIDVGRNEDELREIFKQIVSHTNPGDHVIMDITHSLRNIPIQALVALNYAKVIKDVYIEGIYHGAFEIGIVQEETKVTKTIKCSCGNGNIERIEGVKRVEIFNLNTYIELLDWTHAINTFLQTGSANEVKNLFDQKRNLLNKQQDTSINALNGVVGALYNFTTCISNSRGMEIKESVKKRNLRSIGIAANNLNVAIKELDRNSEEKIPIAILFERVAQEIEPFVDKDNLGIGLATVEWCIRYDMIQQGYTALEESLITFVCREIGLDDTDKELREEKANKILACLKLEKKEWKLKEENREFVEYGVNYFTIQFPTLIAIAHQVKEKRNDINHFGFRKNALATDILKSELASLYNSFKNKVVNKSVNVQVYK